VAHDRVHTTYLGVCFVAHVEPLWAEAGGRVNKDSVNSPVTGDIGNFNVAHLNLVSGSWHRVHVGCITDTAEKKSLLPPSSVQSDNPMRRADIYTTGPR
jgi:hypothetical protein